MEVRCGKCNKLFRVADEKITGSGIKFSCTQCGDTVKITREELDTYTLSKTAVSALDMFEPKPKPGATSILEPGTEKAAEHAPDRDAVAAQTPLPAPKELDQSSSSIPDLFQEKKEPAFLEPNPFEEMSVGDAQQPGQEPSHESEQAIAVPVEPGPEQEISVPIEIEEKKEPELYPEPAIETKPQKTFAAEAEPEQKQEHKTAPGFDLVPVPKPEPKPVEPVTKPHVPEVKPAIQPKPAPARTAVPPAKPKKEPVHPVMEQNGHITLQIEPRSKRMVIVLLSAIILLGALGYGVYKFVLPSMQNQNADQLSAEMTSIEGLRVVNPSGSVEPNGDLLITGLIENLTDKERSGWYVVVDVYDAKGGVLNKIRLLNGKQIYSHADYDILSKRGVNVIELKTKTLQNQGVVIPAKGSVPFEMRYIQPPVGIASFNAQLLPFDPIRLFKEIEQETK